MGGKGSRLLSDEEKLMVKHETSLKYCKIRSRQGVMLFKKHSSKQKLTYAQLQQTFEKLDLDLKKLDIPNSAEAKFYSKIQDGPLYSQRKLAVLAVILGKGLPLEKANLLFEEYDKDIDETFSREEANDFMEVQNILFINAFMELAISNAKSKNKELLQRYHDKLEQNLEIGEAAFIKLLFPTEDIKSISKKQFLDIMARQRPDLLTSSGFRQFIFNSDMETNAE